MGMRSPIFQPKRWAVFAPAIAPWRSLTKFCHWSSGTTSSGHDLALIFDVDHELREEVFFFLINAAEPIVVRDVLDPGDALNLVAVGQAAAA
jgi:hypothetical protein